MGIRSQLESEFDYDIVDDFIDHFDIMCEVLEPMIISLENEANRTEKTDELFRIFHNLKSAAGFLKIERMLLLTKLAEEMLEEIRESSKKIDAPTVDWLLSVSDQLRRWYAQIENDEEMEPIDENIINVPKL